MTLEPMPHVRDGLTGLCYKCFKPPEAWREGDYCVPLDDKDLPIGNEHWIRYFGWYPNRELNPQHKDRPDIPKAGIIITHRRRDNGYRCVAAANFDFPAMREVFGGEHFWQVQSFEPLTISPSVLCKGKETLDGPECGDHGFIQNGRWVKA